MKKLHIGCFEDFAKPPFLISDTYPVVWQEHIYDSVVCARLEPDAIELAKNTISLFMDYQTGEVKPPCYFLNPTKCSLPRSPPAGFDHV